MSDNNETIWNTFDNLFKTVYRQAERVTELERRTTELERRLAEYNAVEVCAECKNTMEWHKATNFAVCKQFVRCPLCYDSGVLPDVESTTTASKLCECRK